MPSPTLEIRPLSLVNEIAATGSVTRAAEKLHLTQSALSHQLRDIESRLGLQLFLRLGKRMVLTPPGERVLGAASRVLDEISRAEDDLRLSRIRYEGGEGSALDVVTAQSQLAQARSNHYTALANYLNARADLEVASGQ